MFTKRNTLIYILLALAVLVSSVAWTPLNSAASAGWNPKDLGSKDPDDAPCVVKADGTVVSGSYKACKGFFGWLKSKQGPRPSFSVYVTGNLLFVDGSRFTRRHSYFVRVRKPSGTWERLGVVTADNGGEVSDFFRLSDALRRAQHLNVCLKDVITNKSFCTWARFE